MAAKKRRVNVDSGVQQLLHCGGVSTLGLANILKTVKQHGLPAAIDRRQLNACNLAAFESLSKTVDLELENGGTFALEYIDPAMLITRAVRDNSDLQKWFREALRRRPPSANRPWRLIVGYDEYIPGSNVRVHAMKFVRAWGVGVMRLGRSQSLQLSSDVFLNAHTPTSEEANCHTTRPEK